MKILLTILLSFTLPILLLAGSITGKVVNDKNEPLVATSVYLTQQKSNVILKTTITNAEGTYFFGNVNEGEYYIEARMIGFDSKKSNVFNFSAQTLTIEDLKLNANTKTLGEVTVEGKKPLIESKDGKLVLNVENSSISAGNNAFEVIKRAPGVNVDKDDNITLMGKEGVNITIDGRQTYMSNEQLASFLKSTDGSQIKSIELSTTRSAKEDAEGAAGIINITMKKNKLEGFNGTFSASAAMGKFFRGNSSLNLNYKKNNTTIFSNYSYTNNKTDKQIGIERIIPNSADETIFDQQGEFISLNKTHNYKIGLEQKTSARNTFMIQFTGNNNLEDENIPSVTNMSSKVNVLDSIMKTISNSHESFNRYSFNANNEFKIDSTGKIQI